MACKFACAPAKVTRECSFHFGKHKRPSGWCLEVAVGSELYANEEFSWTVPRHGFDWLTTKKRLTTQEEKKARSLGHLYRGEDTNARRSSGEMNRRENEHAAGGVLFGVKWSSHGADMTGTGKTSH